MVNHASANMITKGAGERLNPCETGTTLKQTRPPS